MSKNILVTGAAGFVGARFVERCNREAIRVISVDDPSYFIERTEHQGVAFGDVVDRATLFEWLETTQPKLDAIVHLGACTDTTEFDVAYLNKMNLEYSKKLWAYAATHKIPFVYASSAATYGDGALGYDDDESRITALNPLNPYGQSKQDFDVWALEQTRSGQTPPTWAGFKFFNVYGFGERHKTKMASVVLHAFDQIQTTGKVRLFKSHKDGIVHGEQKRDFVFVDDVVDVLFFALESPIQKGIFNLGTGTAQTYLALAQAVFKALSRQQQIEFIDMPIEIRDKYQYFTEARMEKLRRVGYSKTFTSLDAGVERYVGRLLEAR